MVLLSNIFRTEGALRRFHPHSSPILSHILLFCGAQALHLVRDEAESGLVLVTVVPPAATVLGLSDLVEQVRPNRRMPLEKLVLAAG